MPAGPHINNWLELYVGFSGTVFEADAPGFVPDDIPDLEDTPEKGTKMEKPDPAWKYKVLYVKKVFCGAM